MKKTAISVTLEEANIAWLKGRVGATGLRSVSELLDRIVTGARGARTAPSTSVVGTIDILADDPSLDEADAAVRALYQRSLGRPFLLRDTPAKAARARSAEGRRRG